MLPLSGTPAEEVKGKTRWTRGNCPTVNAVESSHEIERA